MKKYISDYYLAILCFVETLWHELYWNTRLSLFSFLKKKHTIFRILNDLHKNGYAHYENYLTQDEVTILREELRKTMVLYKNHEDDISKLERVPGGLKLKHLAGEFSFSKLFTNDLVPQIIAAGYIGKPRFYFPAVIYTCTHDGSNVVEGVPGTSSNVMNEKAHRDNWKHYLKMIIALDDISEENGPTILLEGTHRISTVSWREQFYTFRVMKKTPEAKELFLSGEGAPTKEQVENLLPRHPKAMACLKAGDTFIFDAKSLHYASNLVSGSRGALFVLFPN